MHLNLKTQILTPTACCGIRWNLVLCLSSLYIDSLTKLLRMPPDFLPSLAETYAVHRRRLSKAKPYFSKNVCNVNTLLHNTIVYFRFPL